MGVLVVALVPAVMRRPVPSIMSSSSTLSLVLPKASECEPQALLPIIPPSVARAQVDGSGPKRRPCGAAACCSVPKMRPGSIRAVRASGSSSTMRFTERERSMTMPGPMSGARGRRRRWR